jgi:hypothetical protein
VPILPALAAELRAHRSRVAERSLVRVKPDELVFTTATGRPHGRRNLLRAIYTAGDAAGLNGEGVEPVGVHDLRHSFVALALAAGDSSGDRRACPSCKPARGRRRLRGPDDRKPRAARREARSGVRHPIGLTRLTRVTNGRKRACVRTS